MAVQTSNVSQCPKSPDYQYLHACLPTCTLETTVGKLEAIVTIEALALWFRSNAQRLLHDQLHGPTSSLQNFRRIPADGVAVHPRMLGYS